MGVRLEEPVEGGDVEEEADEDYEGVVPVLTINSSHQEVDDLQMLENLDTDV